MNKIILEEIKAWLNFVDTDFLSYKKCLEIVKKIGNPIQYIGTKSVKLKEIDYLTDKQISILSTPNTPDNWDNICKLIEKYNIKFISFFDDKYPDLLKQIYDPPLYLFYRGELRKNDLRRTFATVGTRKATIYGKRSTEKIVNELANAGLVIVSGLAYGIDSIAHKTALKAKKRTIAIVATGCEQVYPKQHQNLASQIIDNGAIISEFRPGSKLDRWKFVQRNRIVSGICLGTFVVEGSKKSGSLITADFALTQNRDVFALPGDINKSEAEGPNYLIKNGAIMVTNANDILDLYNLHKDEKGVAEFPELTEQENLIYQIILKNKPEIDFDRLLIKSKLSIGELSTVILMLEMKSVIEKLPSNKIAPLI
ncbi:MAG: DNA-processing protein DprA [Candidatus Cloacimonadota bacterium]|nr:DNA-processing protein DprA [Candidatus Cloacimonadota bacterium]